MASTVRHSWRLGAVIPLCAVVLFSFAASSSCYADEKTKPAKKGYSLDEVVLWVGKKKFTLEDVDRSMRSNIKAMQIVNRNPERLQEVRKASAMVLAEEELLIQYGREHDLIDDQAAKAYRKMIEDNAPNKARSRKIFKAQGLYYSEYLNNLERQNMVMQVIDKATKDKRKSSKAELLNVFSKDPAQFKYKRQVSLQQIVQGLPSNRSASKNVQKMKAKLKESFKKLAVKLKANPEFFSQAVAKHSSGSSKNVKGMQGWIGEGVLPEKIQKVVFALKPGEVSDIVYYGHKQYLFKVLDRKGFSETPTFEESKELVRQAVEREKARVLLERLKAKLKAKYPITVRIPEE